MFLEPCQWAPLHRRSLPLPACLLHSEVCVSGVSAAGTFQEPQGMPAAVGSTTRYVYCVLFLRIHTYEKV